MPRPGHPGAVCAYLVGDTEVRSVLDAVLAGRQRPRPRPATGSSVGVTPKVAKRCCTPPDRGRLRSRPDPARRRRARRRPAGATQQHQHHHRLRVGYLVLAATGYDAIDQHAEPRVDHDPRQVRAAPLIGAACTTTRDLFTVYNRMSIAHPFKRNTLSTPPWSTGFKQDSAGGAAIRTPVLIVPGGEDTSVPESIIN